LAGSRQAEALPHLNTVADVKKSISAFAEMPAIRTVEHSALIDNNKIATRHDPSRTRCRAPVGGYLIMGMSSLPINSATLHGYLPPWQTSIKVKPFTLNRLDWSRVMPMSERIAMGVESSDTLTCEPGYH
jgi:hypothetical protein